MKLDFIPLANLTVSKTNMRYGKKDPDVSDILPTVRRRGVIQTLIVRPNCDPGAYEIIGGWRRFVAARIVAPSVSPRATRQTRRCRARSSKRATTPPPSSSR